MAKCYDECRYENYWLGKQHCAHKNTLVFRKRFGASSVNFMIENHSP